MDQEGAEVANGSANLAEAILRQGGDLKRSERLARDALRIRFQLHGPDHNKIGFSTMQVAKILQFQENIGVETKELYERSLAIFTENEGPYGANTTIAMKNISQFYLQFANVQTTIGGERKQLLLTKPFLEKLIRNRLRYCGPTHEETVSTDKVMSIVINRLSDIEGIDDNEEIWDDDDEDV